MKLNLGEFNTTYIHGISEIIRDYDAFLVDIWGVLHDSAKPYPGVLNCLRKLQASQKKTLLVSNAARRSEVLVKELNRFGITPALYDEVVTSGEILWRSFSVNKDKSLKNLGKIFYLIGSEEYRLTDGLPLQQTQDLHAADFILNISVIGNQSSTADNEDVLKQAAIEKLPMVCANPDMLVVRDGVMGIAPGAIAVRYEELGGQVVYYGKPHKAIYTRCLEILRNIDCNRIVAIGDALKTDIAGANANQLDSILVAGGIHARELDNLPENTEGLVTICTNENQYPAMIIKGFYW